MQSEIYHSLKNKTVSDLYWLLFSDAPLSDTYDLSPYGLFPPKIIDEWQIASTKYFLELDKNNSEIENFVKRKKNKRLGFYAEALLSYFFQTFREIELLLQNFQIIDRKRTIGEIDFIILYNQKVIHLECAVKYYMLKDVSQKNNPSQWVGPRLKDNLELKLNKIIQHQIPLGLRKEIQDEVNRPIDCSYLFLKGVFFAEEEIKSGKINRNKPNRFIRLSDLRNLDIKPVEILTRPNWLSSLAFTQLSLEYEYKDIDKSITNPEIVFFNDGKVRFIVPDNWGE